jgi:VWFA-related protein
MDWTAAIGIDAGVLGGKPLIRGTRLAVEFVVGPHRHRLGEGGRGTRSRLSRGVHAMFATAVAFLVVGQASVQPPTIPSAVELVRLDVVAVDRDGQPVPGLRAEDFEVREEGQPQKVTSFESVVVTHAPVGVTGLPAPLPTTSADETVARVAEPSGGRHILVFFDDVHISSVSAERVRSQLGPYLQKELRDGDWVTVVAPERRLNWTARDTSEYRLLPELIRRLSGQYVRDPFHGSIGEWEAMQAVEGRLVVAPRDAIAPRAGQRQAEPSGSSAPEIYAIAQRRIRKTLDALDRAVESLASLPGHKALILFSEGFILAPPLEEYYSRVIDAARRAQVAISFVNLEGLTSGLPQAADSSQPVTRRLQPGIEHEGQIGGTTYISFATGGRDYGTNDVVAGLQQVMRESSVYYLLGYEPSARGDNLRKVRVRVLRDGCEVRARDRYFLKRIGREPRPTERALEAVGDETGLSLGVRSRLGQKNGRGETQATLTIRLVPSTGSAAQRDVRIAIQARRLAGGTFDYKADARTEPSAPNEVQVTGLHLLPGNWQIRVVVQDRQTAALGSVLHRLEVPGQ